MASRWLLLLTVVGTVFSMDPFFVLLAWSFECLARGVHPYNDCNGDAFAATSKRGKLAGSDICGGYKIMVVWTTGDLMWLVKFLNLEYYYNSAGEFCHRCFCTKRNGLLNGFIYSKDAPWSLTKRIHMVYAATCGHDLSCLKIPGVHLLSTKFDAMHVLFLGLLQWAIGSCFLDLLNVNLWAAPAGGRWQQRYSAQLRSAYADFKVWLKQSRLQCRQKRFSLARICTQLAHSGNSRVSE